VLRLFTIVVVSRSSGRLPFVYNMAPCVLKRLLPKPDGFDEIQNARNNEAKRRHLLDIDEGEQEEKRRRIQEQGKGFRGITADQIVIVTHT
jgi:hypothetical protein